MFFTIYLTDLDFRKQEELINELKFEILNKWRDEGEDLLEDDWEEPKPKTWQEAFLRTNFYVGYDESVDWESLIEEFAEEEARKKLQSVLDGMRIEVEI